MNITHTITAIGLYLLALWSAAVLVDPWIAGMAIAAGLAVTLHGIWRYEP